MTENVEKISNDEVFSHVLLTLTMGFHKMKLVEVILQKLLVHVLIQLKTTWDSNLERQADL